MLAAKLYGPQDIRLVECPIPEINEDEILLKIVTAAICGSDLRMIGNGYRGVDAEHPLTLGHEISGIIAKVGKNVQRYRVGMRAAVAPNFGCGVCDACVAGNTHLCENYQAFGINLDGGFAEYMRVDARAIRQGNLLVLEDMISMEVGALLEPLSCVMNGQEQVNVHLNDVVLVIGAGPIGVMHAMLAKARGAAKVLVCDLSEERVKHCMQIEPSLIAVNGADMSEDVMSLTNGRGVDVCITACPSPAAQRQALSLMAMNGRVLYFGGLPSGKDEVCLTTNLIHYRQLHICGSTRANLRQYRQVAAMAAAGQLNLSPLVTSSWSIRQCAQAFIAAQGGKELKTVISFD